MLDSLCHDVKSSLRTLLRSRGFTIVTVMLLALGTGANTAIFSVMNTVMLRRLPVRAPSELVYLLSVYPGEPRNLGFHWNAYEHYRANARTFSDLIAVAPTSVRASYEGLEGEPVPAQFVSGNFFSALGVQLAIGQPITPQNDVPGGGAAAVAVLSWSAWQRHFGGNPGAVGRRLAVDGTPVIVSGVAPRGFGGVVVGLEPELWLPAAAEPLLRRPSARERGTLPVGIVGRLKPGSSIGDARVEMAVLDRPRRERIAESSKDPAWLQARLDVESAAAGVAPLRDQWSGPLLVIMASVGILLLLACTNIASMLLARGVARERELAVRVSLGASPGRLAREVLSESLMLSTAGSVAGVIAGVWGARLLARILTSGRLPPGFEGFTLDPSLDLNLLLFTTAVAITTGVLFGLAPAWHALATAPIALLRDQWPSPAPRRLWTRALVIVQIAVSLVALTAAALFVGHLSRLRSEGTGFDRESVLLVRLDPARTGYDPAQLSQRYKQLLERLTALPGVQGATLSGATPIDGGGASRFVDVEGVREDAQARRRVAVNWTAPKYFATYGTPLVAGRDFTDRDETGPPAAIVNEAMARHYFGGSSPLGRRFTFDGGTRRYEVIGVVADAKYTSIHEPPPRTIYLNAFQDAPGRTHQFALRTLVPPLSLAEAVRAEVRAVLKDVPVAKLTTLEDQVDAALVPERLIATLSTMFGVVAAALAVVGVYGLLAFTVSRRVREIGIRMALGASGSDVARMVVGGAAGLVCAGLLLGAPLAFWSKQLAAGVIPNLRTESVLPVAFGCIALLVAAAAAAYVPTRRALKVDPAVALRQP